MEKVAAQEDEIHFLLLGNLQDFFERNEGVFSWKAILLMIQPTTFALTQVTTSTESSIVHNEIESWSTNKLNLGIARN